jgi:hypothetical protein
VDNEQKIHYIPSKHCVLSGAQARESKLKCSSASQMALVLAGLVIFVLFIIIVLIYQRNKRYVIVSY